MEWRLISEELPPKEEWVLLSLRYSYEDDPQDEDDYEYVVTFGYFMGDGEYFFADPRYGGYDDDITAWMPLPSPCEEA